MPIAALGVVGVGSPIVASPELQRQADSKPAQRTPLHLLLTSPDEMAVQTAAASLHEAHERATDASLRRVLRSAELGAEGFAWRQWLAAVSGLREARLIAHAEAAIEASATAASAAHAGAHLDAVAELAVLRERVAASEARADTAEMRRRTDANAREAAYEQLLALSCDLEAQLAAERAARVQMEAAHAEALRSARDALARLGETLGAMHAASLLTRATRHAHGASLMRASDAHELMRQLGRAFAMWLRAALASAQEAASSAEAHASVLGPALDEASVRAASEHETAVAREAELRAVMDERERNYKAELALMEHDIGTERAKAHALVGRHREEADEVVRVAAEECARVREAMNDARLVFRADQAALAHWAAALLITSCLRAQGAVTMARALRLWAAAVAVPVPVV